MLRGGATDGERTERFMWARVGLQAVTLLLLVIGVIMR